MPLLHISTPDQLDEARLRGQYLDPSLESEGFIHLSTPEQVLIPANERYAGQAGLILLVIDPARLTKRLVFEDSYGSGIEFPHVYGPIDLEAIVDTVDFPANPDGSFDLPATLRSC